MFSLRNFIKKGLLEAIGYMADYQIILNAVGWLEKGVLTEDDLAEIEIAIEEYHEKEEEEKLQAQNNNEIIEDSSEENEEETEDLVEEEQE